MTIECSQSVHSIVLTKRNWGQENMENPIIFTAEIIGTIAFASSGAMLGIRKNLDLFGVLVLGLCVAVGGGIVRILPWGGRRREHSGIRFMRWWRWEVPLF